MAACSLDSLSFFLAAASPPSSSRELDGLSASLSSLSLLFPLILDTVLFGDETMASSSQSAVAVAVTVAGLFTSIPRRKDLGGSPALFLSADDDEGWNASARNKDEDLKTDCWFWCCCGCMKGKPPVAGDRMRLLNGKVGAGGGGGSGGGGGGGRGGGGLF